MAADVATKLKNTIDIDGKPLLDNTLMLLLPDMGDGGSHDHTHLAPVIVGKCGGALAPGRSIRYAEGTPMGNLYVSLAHAFGLGDVTKFGIDDAAPLDGLTG